MALEIVIKEAIVGTRDKGGMMMAGRPNPKTIKMSYFTTDEAAKWICKKQMKRLAYPFSAVEVNVNRNLHRVQVGDVIHIYYEMTPTSIVNGFYTVVKIEEEAPDSEIIKLSLVEEAEMIGLEGEPDLEDRYYSGERTTPGPFAYQAAFEAPWHLSGEEVWLVTLGTRVTGQEIGYDVHLSMDGSQYDRITTANRFNPSGALVEAYSDDTDTIDDIGFTVDMEDVDLTQIQTVTEQDIYGTRNLAILGEEIITFRDFTPLGGTLYRVSHVVRGRFGTQREEHAANERFFFLGNGYGAMTATILQPGNTVFAKLDPYTGRSIVPLSDCEPQSVEVVGKCYYPLCPINLAANDECAFPTYEAGEDIVFTWGARIRGQGTGIGTVSTTAPGEKTWEGLFQLQLFSGGILLQSVSDIDDIEWTLTWAANNAFVTGGISEINVKVQNYQLVNGVRYPAAMDLYAPNITTDLCASIKVRRA